MASEGRRGTAMTLLELRGVSKRFGGVQALRDVSFAVREGAIVGIMGANGAGKTTLFALIAGHERPTSGEILFRGESLVGLRPDQVCRRGVARTFQVVRPFAGLTVRDNVVTGGLFGSRRHDSRREAEAAAERILREVGLWERRHDTAGSLTLSGQKRLEIARAVATGARLVLLDEVMAGLTPVEVEAMLETIRGMQAAHGLTLLIIEHVMRALMRLCEETVVLHLGEKIAQGLPGSIAEDPAVLRCYLGEDA